jgi:hypothetical protein
LTSLVRLLSFAAAWQVSTRELVVLAVREPAARQPARQDLGFDHHRNRPAGLSALHVAQEAVLVVVERGGLVGERCIE